MQLNSFLQQLRDHVAAHPDEGRIRAGVTDKQLASFRKKRARYRLPDDLIELLRRCNGFVAHVHGIQMWPLAEWRTWLSLCKECYGESPGRILADAAEDGEADEEPFPRSGLVLAGDANGDRYLIVTENGEQYVCYLRGAMTYAVGDSLAAALDWLATIAFNEEDCQPTAEKKALELARERTARKKKSKAAAAPPSIAAPPPVPIEKPAVVYATKATAKPGEPYVIATVTDPEGVSRFGVSDVRLSPDGRYLAYQTSTPARTPGANLGKRLQVLNVESDQLVMDELRETNATLDFAPDAPVLLEIGVREDRQSENSTIRPRPLAVGAESSIDFAAFKLTHHISEILVLPSEGKLIATSVGGIGGLSCLDLQSGELLWHSRVEFIRGLLPAPDGRLLVGKDWDGYSHIFDLRDGKQLKKISDYTVPLAGGRVALRRQNKKLGLYAQVIDPATGEKLEKIKTPQGIGSLTTLLPPIPYNESWMAPLKLYPVGWSSDWSRCATRSEDGASAMVWQVPQVE